MIAWLCPQETSFALSNWMLLLTLKLPDIIHLPFSPYPPPQVSDAHHILTTPTLTHHQHWPFVYVPGLLVNMFKRMLMIFLLESHQSPNTEVNAISVNLQMPETWEPFLSTSLQEGISEIHHTHLSLPLYSLPIVLQVPVVSNMTQISFASFSCLL